MSLIPAFEIGVWNAWIFMVWLVIQNYGIKLFSKEIYQKAGGSSDVELSNVQKITGYISVTLWLLTTIYSIFLPLKLGTLWFYVGLIMFLLGLIINIVVTVNFITTPIRDPVTKGVYRYSRHPLALGTVVPMIGVGIASASWLFLLLSAILMVISHFSAITEERATTEKFGDAYSEYLARTPRWIGLPKSGKG